jgi:hypothetical protein
MAEYHYWPAIGSKKCSVGKEGKVFCKKNTTCFLPSLAKHRARKKQVEIFL